MPAATPDPRPVTEADIPRLLAELSLEEKASLCSGQDFWHSQAVPRLGIGAVMLTDGPHGLRKQVGATDHLGLNDSVPATCFPSAAGLGSTWDRDLVRRIGEALGAEARANDVAVLLGPGVNIKRSPLCGRNFEYFSEDPHLAGELAAPLVAGIQSAGVGASVKHFAANNQETDRMRVSAEVDERTLREMYFPAFETVVRRARPWTVMCAYNKVNGVLASQDPWLLTTVLREEWGFDGLVVSDWGAVDDRVAGVAAGLDLEMPSSHGINDARIVAAVRSGDLAGADLDRVVARVLGLVARAAVGSSGEPAGTASPTAGRSDHDDHHALAREAAAAAAVLLRNESAALPLDAGTVAEKAVLIGELARTPRYQGAGSSLVNPTRLDSIVGAFTERGIDIPFHPGYRLAGVDGQRSDADLRAEAVAAAAGRTAILVLGLPPEDESEGYDRTDLDLPASHRDLLAAVAEVADRVIVLLANGAVVSVADWQHHCDALLELWLGGQAGGSAAVDLLLGDRAPSGRLAESIPVRLADLPAQLNFPGADQVVRYGEGIFVGYRGLDAMDQPVAHPFGHGLTYTTFGFADLRVEQVADIVTAAADLVALQATARVTNTGTRPGVAVPQLYVGRPDSALARAPRELRGFDRVALQPGESAEVCFELTGRDLAHWDVVTGDWQVEPGTARIWVGASSRDLPLATDVTIAAPPVRRPLGRWSTIAEWLDDAEAGPKLRDALGEAGGLLGPDSPDPTMAALLSSLPVGKVSTMGLADIRELLGEHEAVAGSVTAGAGTG